MPKKSKALYRNILSESWKITLERKWLWIFAFLASILSSGGVYEVAFRGLKNIKQSANFLQQVLSGSLPGYDTIVQYIQQLAQSDATQIQTVLTIATLAFFLFIFVSVCAQGVVLLSVRGKHKTLNEQIKKSKSLFWPLFGINLISKLLVLLFMFLSTLILLLFMTETNLLYSVISFASFFLFLIATIIISSVSILSFVSIAKHDHTMIDAIHESLIIFKKNWIVCLEMGVLIFFISTLAAMVNIGIVLLLTLPYSLIIMVSLMSGSAPLYLFLLVLGTVFVLVLTALISALVTQFSFAAWTLFYERATKGGIFSTIERILSHGKK